MKLSIQQFESIVCDACGLCKKGEHSLNFCFAMYTEKPDVFLWNVILMAKLVAYGSLSAQYLKSPEGFFETLCGPEACPGFDMDCHDTRIKQQCFTQWSIPAGLVDKEEMFEVVSIAYHKACVRNINNEERIADKAWTSLKKNRQAKIQKVIRKLFKRIDSKSKKAVLPDTSRKLVITTAVITNNNPEWIEYLKLLLEEDDL